MTRAEIERDLALALFEPEYRNLTSDERLLLARAVSVTERLMRERDALWCRALINLGDTHQTERVTTEFNRLRDTRCAPQEEK